MNDDPTPLSKRDALETLLAHGDVLLQLDPRTEGVDVPPGLRGQALLVLRLGLDMPVPIPDLHISVSGVQATLSFSRQPYHVEIPWQAVFGMVSESGDGLLWTGDVPAEVMAQMLEIQRHGRGEADTSAALPQAGPRLMALDGGRAGVPRQSPDEAGPKVSPLKLVR